MRTPEKCCSLHQHPLNIEIHRRHHIVPPAHHITSKLDQHLLNSLSLVPSTLGKIPTPIHIHSHSHHGHRHHSMGDNASITSSQSSIDAKSHDILGFRNPWPSWHKPGFGEVWNGLSWIKKSQDESIEENNIVASEGELTDSDEVMDDKLEKASLSDEIDQKVEEIGLHILKPDFETPGHNIAKVTWLGHASVLLQLPCIAHKEEKKDRSTNVLFDPIFSMRCSPTQYIGPLRHFHSPCAISALPNIDLVVISHSHYDHLDYDSILDLWHLNQDHLRFAVPLGLKDWFLQCKIGIPEDRVTELDWWDEVWLHEASTLQQGNDKLRVICTPAQHGSGRYAVDASRSLWASWTMEYISQGETFRVFFGGDTGFQFHSPGRHNKLYPTCPAFAEVCKFIGKPDLSLLPISVGASYNFIKSYDMLGLIPDLDHGLTAANHLTPQDAVRVAKILRDFNEDNHKGVTDGGSMESGQLGGVAMAIHWGTFVVDLEEVKQSMKDLQRACKKLDVEYITQMDQRSTEYQKNGTCSRLQFACINHGQSIYLSIKQKDQVVVTKSNENKRSNTK